MNKLAFTLIELLVYVTLFSFFSLAAFGFYGVIHYFCYEQTRIISDQLQNALVVDMIYKDLICACSNQSLWNVSGIIFARQTLAPHGVPKQVSVGWQVGRDASGNRCVRRSEGEYDFFKQIWKKRTINIIYCTLKKLVITVTYSKNRHHIRSVTLVAECQGDLQDVRYAVVRNREIL